MTFNKYILSEFNSEFTTSKIGSNLYNKYRDSFNKAVAIVEKPQADSFNSITVPIIMYLLYKLNSSGYINGV